MDLFEVVTVILQIAHVLAKKRYVISSSDESIENILYYKDCKHMPKSSETEIPALRAVVTSPPPPPVMPLRSKPQCTCPKLCCNMCCSNDCYDQPNFLNRQMGPIQNQLLQPIQTLQTVTQPQVPIQPPIMRKKKKRQQSKIEPPLGGRRDFGFTKESIKSLISKDEDIKKILKDLVRVTMQKVDLLEVLNSRRKEKTYEDEVSNSEDVE